MENKLYLVGNTEHQFKRKMYGKNIFEKVPLIYREKGSGTRHVMEKYIEQNLLPVRKKWS